jgi:transcriptional regulator with XRE-family HTH domain
VGTPDAIRVNRVKLGLTQAQLARDIGVDTRQINRYETGETEPTLAIARRLADKLRITMDELAGGLSPLNGTWHAAWHNLTPDAADNVFHTSTVELAQQGHHLTIQPLRGRRPGRELSADDTTELVWSAEVFVDVDSLLGGYRIDTPALRGRGLLNLTHHDTTIEGTWVRIALIGSSTGNLVLARNLDIALTRVNQLLEAD